MQDWKSTEPGVKLFCLDDSLPCPVIFQPCYFVCDFPVLRSITST